MELSCYLLDGGDIDIHPAPRRRAWMDETPNAYAYRCLPLSIANVHGWEIRCRQAVDIRWNGGDGTADLEISAPDGEPPAVSSHFGSGIVTFRPAAIFRTPLGYNLWVTGPANHIKDGIQPLAAVVETDWIPFPFTMNWKVTRPDATIRFDRGEPFCFLFPVPRGLLERFEPRIRDAAEEPDLRQMYQYARNWRSFLEGLRFLKSPESEEHRYQKWYLNGAMPDGSRQIPGHQKNIAVKPFARPSGPPAGAGDGG